MDIFSTGVLARVVSELPAPAPFFLNSFFRAIQTETSEEIHFDIESGRRRLAPFVSPIVAGQVVRSKGYQTKTFTPAYVKDKRVFDASRPFKRAIGERIGGDMSPAQRMQAALAYDLKDQIDMVTRRQEVMAIEALRTGKIVVVGDNYPEVEVNFGRDASLTVALITTARWGESGVSPLADVRTWSMNITKLSGTAANVVVMDPKAFDLFAADPAVAKLLDRFRGSDMLVPTVVGEGGRYMGSIGEFDIWVNAGWYEHPTTGALTPFLPDYTVIITSADLEGTRCYGAIKDEEAGFQAVPYFAKSWVEKDPAARMLLLQSAPLPVPYRVNASMCATVR
jgi:hypothetical protein